MLLAWEPATFSVLRMARGCPWGDERVTSVALERGPVPLRIRRFLFVSPTKEQPVGWRFLAVPRLPSHTAPQRNRLHLSHGPPTPLNAPTAYGFAHVGSAHRSARTGLQPLTHPHWVPTPRSVLYTPPAEGPGSAEIPGARGGAGGAGNQRFREGNPT